jgi:hypothetical protein
MAFGFFDGQKADASPESIKRKRAMIAQLLSGGRAPRNIGEGFSSIGDSVAAAILGARADAEEKASNASSAEAMRNIYSGFGSPMAAVGGNPVATGRATGSGATDDTYTGAPSGLFSSESGGRFTAQNNATGAGGMKGHFGRVQFGQARLQEAAAAGAIPQGTTPQQFMASPDLQRAAERWHFADIDNRIKASGIDQKFGQTINGVPITRDGLVAVAHLGGIRGMQRFVETGGRYNPRDANGTSLMDYFARMGGQKQMASRMPVINPGPGATPMPLARQNAQTAPMPNVAMADLPAPGANQSASNVAPVQGDNPQQLLAEADYYEQNGNVEAARQMRERAAMAGQPAPAAAFPLPEDGSQPNPLRDMFSARGVGFADNEAETQGFEARMAQEQAGAPAPDPSQVQTVAITPNAQNADDVFSPIPMGIGPNPFVPRDAAPPADVAAQGADQTAVSPRMVTAPMPPPRPADLRQQSPFVPPSMRAPLPVDMGGENSGGSAMQFIESEFARREGRPDPRMAIGAPQGYNPFVPQALQAPQMAGDGGSVQGASQGGAMAGGSAQAPAQSSNRIAYLASVAGNSMNSAEVRQLAMTEIQAERARALAEAERARTEQQSRQAYEAAGVNPALRGDPVVGKAAIEAKYREAPETFRDLTPAERTQRGIDPNDKRPYQISNKTGKLSGVGGAQTTVNVDASQKAEDAFGVETGKALAKRFDEMVGDGDVAAQNLELVSELRRLGGRIDFGAPAVAKGFLGRFGIKTEGISDIEAFNTLINRLTPQQRLPGTGATSDFDAKMFKESLPQLMNTPEGNKLIIDTIEKVSQNRIARGEIAMRVQMGELPRKEGIAELRRLQSEAKGMSDSIRDFGKTKTTTTDRPGAAQPQQGQPTPAEIEAEMKRRGLR